MRFPSIASVAERSPSRRALAALCFLALATSCAKPPSALVFRVLAENLVPAWCTQPAHRTSPECPTGAYRFESVTVRVCRDGLCANPDLATCGGLGGDAGVRDDLFCGEFVSGPSRTAPNVLPGDVVVSQAEAGAARVGISVIARVLVGDTGTTEVIRRQFVVPFVREQTRVVEVWLSSLCIGAVCPPGTTCGRRSCESINDPTTRDYTPLPDAGPVDGGDRDVSFDVVRDARADAAPEAAADVATDVATDASMDAAMDATTDVAMDATTDVAMDVAVDARDAASMDAMDVAMDAGPDVGRMDSVASDGVSTDSGGMLEASTMEPDVVDDRDVRLDGGRDVSGGGCLTMGEVQCGSACANLMTDSQHCGACGNSCGLALCSAGRCVGYRDLAVGGEHVCLVGAGGDLRCWGSNARGQLGIAGGDRAAPTIVMIPGVTVQAVAAGEAHTCALAAGGDVYCWGANDNAQAGVATGNTVAAPTRVSGLTGVFALAAGARHTCALSGARGTSTTVTCWGDASSGRTGTSGGSRQAPTPIVNAAFATVTAITAGESHTCVLLADGGVRCFGANTSGQLGATTRPPTGGPSPITVTNTMAVALRATAITAGSNHTCALTTEGVFCWGDNNERQLGVLATTASIPNAVPMHGASGTPPLPSLLAAGGEATCVRTGMSVECVGSNQYGLVDAAPMVRAPVHLLNNIANTQNATAIRVGAHTACVIRTVMGMDEVWCWGRNTRGQLGRNTTGAGALSPTAARPLGAPGTFVSASVGVSHACAVHRTTSGLNQVWCWGVNESGQCANAMRYIVDTPVQVTLPVGGDPITVCAGNDFSCALVAGSVYCWGDNSQAQLGAPASATPALPGAPVAGVTNATAITCGWQHACALTATGNVVCWGSNLSGQTGQTSGSVTATASVVRDITPTPIVASHVAAGADHTCARLASNGAVVCWGANNSGQLGRTTTNNTDAVPAAATGVTAAASGAALGVGWLRTCVLQSGGGVSCWGHNDSGGLGLPSTMSTVRVPTSVPGVTGATALSLTGQTQCIVTAAGISCWGENPSGQVGNGATARLPVTAPAALAGTAGVASVHAGLGATCMRRPDGTVSCWGANEYGQLGTGNVYSATPAAVVLP